MALGGSKWHREKPKPCSGAPISFASHQAPSWVLGIRIGPMGEKTQGNAVQGPRVLMHI